MYSACSVYDQINVLVLYTDNIMNHIYVNIPECKDEVYNTVNYIYIQ